MTNITIQRSAGHCRLTAVGHATGSREVCAAVSGIVCALGGYLKNLEQAGAVELRSIMLESGAAEIEAAGDAACHPFGMAAVGLLQIQARYPKQIRVETKNFFRSLAEFLSRPDRMGATRETPSPLRGQPPFQGGLENGHPVSPP